MLAFPPVATVEQLEAQHADWIEWHEAWNDFHILHEGGETIRKQATRFLDKRAKEPDDVFNARLKRFGYTNLLGTILGFYSGKVFRTDPSIDKSPAGTNGNPTDKQLTKEQADFFSRFESNCDRAGCSFNDLIRDLFRDMMLYRRGYLLMDLPDTEPGQFANRREQIQAGALDVYLTRWHPSQVINWSEDAAGNLEWIVLQTTHLRASLFSGNKQIDRWTIFDRTSVAVYEREYDAGTDEKPKEARLLRPPKPHVLADQNRVPLYRLDIPPDLWIANRISLPARAYLNLENSLDWALHNQNLAQPVISGRFDGQSLNMSEVGAWVLPEGCEISYLEQTGTAFSTSQDRLEHIREEIYRSAYLMDQGRSTAATPAAQSGISKQADKEPANDVLCAFGDVLRRWMQMILLDAAHVRDIQGVAVDVRGFDFSDEDPTLMVKAAQQAQMLNIPSPTLDKELMKGVALALVPDANQVLKDQIADEIDKAGTRDQRELDRMKAELDVQNKAVKASMSSGPAA